MIQTDHFILSKSGFEPAYLALYNSNELARRTAEAVNDLEKCQTCPRCCGINRLAGFKGTCKAGRQAIVSSAFPHMGEEAPISGWQGSGTIFFSQCSLRCVFCQNFEISHFSSGKPSTPEELAGMMLSLQERGCHNINLVTPDHFIPQILEALLIAIENGFHLPLVYNTSGYTSQKALAWLDGVIDIYMPDFKTSNDSHAKLYLKAKDYPKVATDAITEMHRQVGDLKVDEDGIAKRGLLVRHLVMPENIAETKTIAKILAELSPDTYLNIMSQYRPAGKVYEEEQYTAINRPATQAEINYARQTARYAGLWRFD